ncbi:hypoxia induced protein conserved region-domain-containing protein [Mrakia frigida]|uniref:HIG1 domain-containing protein n=1 Tax=Mrakia frigida TaxID=29902 RepID=UPI003FCC16B9
MSSSPPRPPPIDYDAEYDREVRPNVLNRSAWWNKGIAKMKQNPMVPIATLATCYALWGAIQANRHQDRAKLQKMLRFRVGAQGVAILAIVLGGIFFEGKTPIRDMGKLPDEISRGMSALGDKITQSPSPFEDDLAPPSRRSAPPLLSPPTVNPTLSSSSRSSSPPTLVPGKNGSAPTILGSELLDDVDWKADGGRASARKELRRRQVEEFLARKEAGSGEGHGHGASSQSHAGEGRE